MATMKRGIKATSIDGAIRAIQNVQAPPLPSPYWLSEAQKPIWDEILLRRARDEWTAIDLRFAWDLTEVLVALHAEKKLLVQEGGIIFGERGPKINPRQALVEKLSKHAMALAIYLRIHPASEADYPTLVKGPRKAEKDARAVMNEPKPDLLPVQ